MNKNMLIAIACTVVLLVVGGIGYYIYNSGEDEDAAWSSIVGSLNIADYEHYLQSHPKGDHADEAKAQLALLRDQEAKKQDEAEWAKAVAENTIEAYRNYRNSYTLHADEAKERIDALIRDEIAEEEQASSSQPVEEPAAPQETAKKQDAAEKKAEATEKKPERHQEPVATRTERMQTPVSEPQPAQPQQSTSTISITPVQTTRQPSVTQVTVTSNIPKAMVVIDGQDVGWAPWSGPLTPGMHTFAVKANNKAKLKTMDFNLKISGAKTTIPINVPDPSVFK